MKQNHYKEHDEGLFKISPVNEILHNSKRKLVPFIVCVIAVIHYTGEIINKLMVDMI